MLIISSLFIFGLNTWCANILVSVNFEIAGINTMCISINLWITFLSTHLWFVFLIILAYLLCHTGAQKWHIVSLLGDVTSPTTVAHYVSMTCSEHREALTAAPTAGGLHKQAIRVQGWSTYFATEQVGRLRYVTAVDGATEAFPLSSVICAPVLYHIILFRISNHDLIWHTYMHYLRYVKWN